MRQYNHRKLTNAKDYNDVVSTDVPPLADADFVFLL